MESESIDADVQVDIPEPENEKERLTIKPLERTKLPPKVPIEPSAYGKGKSYSRPWILQDGREPPEKGSEMRRSYTYPKKAKHTGGVRRRMMTDFFWEQVLAEVIEELGSSDPVQEYCTEHNSNYVKENFEPRNFLVTVDKDTHLRYPLYGNGSSPTTFYSETIKKPNAPEILEKFRRSQDFTKPMEERLDNGWVL